MSDSLFAFINAKAKAEELQKKTGKSFNECSSALHLADGDPERALKILRQNPEHSKRLR